MGVAKIELPECWAGVAEPLRTLMAEVEREAHADLAPDELGLAVRRVGERDRAAEHTSSMIVTGAATARDRPRR
jgi:hypothetical protein